MKDWIRGPLGAAGQLRAGSMDEPSPWKMDPATGILLCEGDKVGHEWMRYATELADCVYHVNGVSPGSTASPPTTPESL